jgi:ribosome biogenesis protein NSA1
VRVQTLAAAYSDGSLDCFNDYSDGTVERICSWREPRWKNRSTFVGLAVTDRWVALVCTYINALKQRYLRGTYACTSNGALSLCSSPLSESSGQLQTALLPTRLRCWNLSGNQSNFCYGGDEVDLSLWDAERSFQSPSPEDQFQPTLKKRKRDSQFFPGEIWRAKNVANDQLGLRRPVQITTAEFLSPARSDLIAVGTLEGHVRRYDTRAARRPVAEWTSVAKSGGVKTMHKSVNEQ